ncbi:hypothetical protein HKX48_008922 [Thoreauomyces humboldtii]|nr:hypothetical protein HKX48_008922 [Thoreauomyces humboldtii]
MVDDRSDQHRPESRIIPSPGMAYTDLIRTIHPHFCFTKDAYEFTKKFFSQHGIDKPEKVPTAKSRGIRAMGVPQYLHEDYLSQFRDWELARGMEGSEFDTDEDPDSHSDSDSESNYDLDPGF